MVFSPSGTMVALTSGPGERAALDAMPHLVWMTDREGKRSWLNARWYEYTGLPPSVPDDVVWQRSVHPDDRSAILGSWGGDEGANELLFRVRRHDGAWRWFVMRIVPTGERGERTGWIATATDVDDLKRAELHQREQAQVAKMARVVTDALAHRPSLATALHTSVDALVVHLGAAFARVWTLEDDGRLALRASAGRDPQAPEHATHEPAIEAIARTGQPHHAADVARDRGFAGADLGGATTFAGYPLLAGGGVLGVVAVYAMEPLPEDSLATVAAIADAMALRIASQRTVDDLRASEQRYALVTRATKDAIWDWDLQTDRMLWNRGLSELVGAPSDRLGGDGAWWIANMHPDDRAAVVRSIHAVWDGKGDVWTAEYRFRRATGYARVSDRALIVRGDEGQPVRMIGAMRDVTDAWRAQRSLRVLADAGARLASSTSERDACQRAIDLVVPELADWGFVDLVRDDGTFERLGVAHRDRAFDALLAKLAAEHPPGRGLPEGIDDPADPRLAGGLAWVVRTGQPELVPRATDAQLRAACQDEQHFRDVRALGVGAWLRLPITARGRTIGVMSLVRLAPDPAFDPDDQELLVAIARRAGKFIDGVQLLAAAQRSEQELREVVAKLQRSNEDLDRFAYVAGHDLKAPLRGIAAISQWIQDDLGGKVTPATAEHLQLLRKRVRVLEQLIDGALQFSRAGRGEVFPELVDVAQLVEGAFELLAPPAGASLRLVTPMPVLHTPRTLLQQVFLNLLGNAIKYGGGAEAQVEVAAADEGSHWAFTVRDHGPGIAPEHHQRVWELFQTLQPRDDKSSSGIGLAIVRKIVQRRGGETSVTSALGEGAAFRFTWPKEA